MRNMDNVIPRPSEEWLARYKRAAVAAGMKPRRLRAALRPCALCRYGAGPFEGLECHVRSARRTGSVVPCAEARGRGQPCGPQGRMWRSER